MKHEVVVEGALFGEGPVWCPDGTLVITHVCAGGLTRVWPAEGRSERIADTSGGANAAQLATDGGFIVTQDGGLDFAPFAEIIGLSKDDVPPLQPAPPGLQRVAPDGSVSYVVDRDCQAPNDLIVAADGTVYFTDPPHLTGEPPDPNAPGKGRLFAYGTDGSLRRIADGFSYDNGIAIAPDGRLLVVEAQGLMWVDAQSGEKDWLIEELPKGQGDGFAFDTEGRIYVATPLGRGIQIVEPDGKLGEFWENGGVVTNCCFGGADNRTLFTAELAPGRVLAYEGLPSPGLPLHAWPAPS